MCAAISGVGYRCITGAALRRVVRETSSAFRLRVLA